MAQSRMKEKSKSRGAKRVQKAGKRGKPKAGVRVKRLSARKSATSRRASSALPDLAVQRTRMAEVLRLLKREYPEAKCSLNYETPFQLLIATVLSAQCTDERVNRVTPELFARYPDAHAMAKAPLSEIEKLIRTTGFFRNKALSISETSRILVEKFGGEVPRTLDELTPLRGVGRKTANVVLGNAYEIPGLVVDTHVGRLSRRLGFTQATDPVKVETEMMAIVPQEDWTLFSHLLIDHGRAVCTARRAFCETCFLSMLCPKIGVEVRLDDEPQS